MRGAVRLRRRAPEEARAAADVGTDDAGSASVDALQDGVEKGEVDVVSVEDVRTWLHRVGFGQYETVFLTNEVNGDLLKTLTSENLREDLGIINLRHRRDLGLAIQRLVEATAPVAVDRLPEHGRILDHLSNMLAFSVVALRLAPNYRSLAFVTATSLYFAIVGIIALLYGVLRYRAVIRMIENSGASTPKFNPDRSGIVVMLILILIAGGLTLTLILFRLR